MPVNVVKSKRDEEKWKKATEIAAKAGKENNYAYIMGVYKKMNPDHKFNKTASVILRASKKGNGYVVFSKLADEKKERPDLLKALPGAGAVVGAGIGYKNPELFDPRALFPALKKGTRRAKAVSAILGAGTAATTGWLPSAIKDTYDESKKVMPKRKMEKKAAIGQKSTATQDFLGGFDPTGSFTGAYGSANQARGKTEAEHRKSKGLAVAGGAIGSGVALPMATTGIIEGIQEATKAKGGLGAKLTAGAKGFARGSTKIPRTLSRGFKARGIGIRAMKEGGTTVSKAEKKSLMDLAKQTTLGDLIKGETSSKGIGMLDKANLAVRNRVSKSLGKEIKSKADTGIKAGLGGLALGAGVGAAGAGIQYDKGRRAYEDSVAFSKNRRNNV